MKVRQNLVLATLGAMITVPVSSADTLDMVRDSISGSIPMEVEYNPGPYLSLNASANFLEDVKIKNIPVGSSSFGFDNGKIAFNAGMSLEIGVGIPINSDLAVEFSSGLAYNAVDSVTGVLDAGVAGQDAIAGGDGEIYQIPLVAELVWTVFDHDGFRVDVHGGGGLQWTKADISNIYGATLGSGAANASLTGNAFAFRYQAGVDCMIDLSSSVSLGASFTYSGTTESNFGTANFNSNIPGVSLVGTEDVKTGSFSNLTMGINLRIEF
ncbi:MAG: outer membrane beta-barrel protein [Phycisphaera sp.]|nr:outer membrane beta-barrel protein [Phycisphaera sp.]